uniref:Sushi domain-containing protein n=1 Tax=Junco hyemalis TaxID=40217 RepID=A0A8C5JP90_JUNHY
SQCDGHCRGTSAPPLGETPKPPLLSAPALAARPCPPPPVIAHATLSAEPGTNFTSGTSVSYSCQPGFTLLGDPSVLCTAWGNWSLPYPRSGCGTPTLLLFAELSKEYENQTEFPVGMTVNYTCRPGYVEQPQISSTITCLENLTWSEAQEFCKMLQCPSPPNITKGTHDSQDLEVFPAGMVVNYSCDPGYSLRGEASIHCTSSGNWSLPLPQCAGVVCPAPQIQNGRVAVPKPRYTYGDSVTFKCHRGFTLRASIYCTASGAWSHPPPVCQGAFWLQRAKNKGLLTTIPDRTAARAVPAARPRRERPRRAGPAMAAPR